MSGGGRGRSLGDARRRGRLTYCSSRGISRCINGGGPKNIITLHFGYMVIGYMVKSHIWSIISRFKVESLLLRLIGYNKWSILVAQNRGPYIR